MLFMSAEHVTAMNDVLASSDRVRAACSALPAKRVLSYDLTDGPDGELVNWTVAFGDTVAFSLDRPADPDVVLTGDWKQMVRSSRASRQGEQLDPGVAVTGDMAIVLEVSPLLALAGTVATLPVEFPDC